MEGAEILTRFTADTSQTDKATDELSKSFSKLQKIGEVAFLGIATAINTMTISLLKGGIEYNAEIETYLTRLETLTGSAEKANKILDQIKKDALKTPFDVKSLTQAQSLLLATGMSAEDAREDILALGDAISASGGGNAELQRMAVNLQQIKNVGKASSLDIKQFAYAGIDIYGLLADSMGITKEEATKLEVSYDMLSKALNKASKQGGKYYKAMEKQSTTYAGATGNLKESIDVLKGTIAEGLFNALKDVIPKINEFIDWLTKNKEIIMAIMIPLLTFINTITGMLVISKITAVVIALWTALMAHPFVAIIGGITALVTAFKYLWNNCEGFRNFWIDTWREIKDSFNWAINGIKTGISIVGTGFNTFVKSVGEVHNKVTSGFRKMGNSVGTIFSGIRDTIVNTFRTIGELIKAPINAIIDAINKVLDSINSIQVPDWVPGIGGKHTNFKHIKRLKTGTNYVPQDMLAIIHEGEAVVPKKFNPYANGINQNTIGGMLATTPSLVVNIQNNMEMDTLGQVVNKVKTFSGGAKNDFNYGMGR